MDQVALLLYNNNDKNIIISYSSRVDSLNVLLRWLDVNGIGYIDHVPEKKGLWCVDEDVAYRVYQVTYDKENQAYDSLLVYSLQWIETPKEIKVVVPDA